MIDEKEIGLGMQPMYSKEGESSRFNTSKIKLLRTWLFWKNKPYPQNFIGYGIVTVSKELKISEDKARLLLRAKLQEALPTIKDKTIQEAVEKRILRYTSFREIPINCRRCGKEFMRTKKALKNCAECKEWYRKNGKYAQQPQHALTNEEKQLLEKLRLQK